MSTEIHRLRPGDANLYEAMLDLFGDVFDEHDTYCERRPSATYVSRLLANPTFVGLVALEGNRVTGALAAYELPKFEQARSEFYIYDLAVSKPHRRKGIATALIGETCRIAGQRGGWTVIIQADHDNEEAISLYSKLGTCLKALHFDIPVR